ncbi:MAG TPA: pentapeptide repeat-containing protein, partial [Gaiellaceae bacterium]|nr:pentapeptide repeat-containing protein [Gaiellaceae bacterium]
MVEPVLFRGCSFDRAEFSNLSLGSCRFEGCTFRGTKLTGLESRCAEWVDNTFATRISRCQFYGRPQQPCATTIDGSARSVNAFVGNDFSAAELSDCAFRHGIDLHGQRWPITRAYRVLDHWALRHAGAQQVLVRES